MLEEYVTFCNNGKVFSSFDKQRSVSEEPKESFNLELLKFEYDRNRIAAAYGLVSFLLLLLKKFKTNCYFFLYIFLIYCFFRLFPILISCPTDHRRTWFSCPSEIHDREI